MRDTALIDTAVRTVCPFLRDHCALASLGACSVVDHWMYDHHASAFPPATVTLRQMKMEASRQRGLKGMAMRRVLVNS